MSLWTFDENPDATRTFVDSGPADVAMNVIGTWTSTASIVRGVGGRSVSKTGAAHAIVPSNEPAHDLNALTLSVYYQPRSAAFKQVILNRGDGDAPGDFSIERLPSGRLRGWHVGQDATLRFFGSWGGIVGTNLVNGIAYRIDLTLGPRGAHLYLDGRRLSAATILAHVNGWNNAEPLYVGVWNNGRSYAVDGTIDHLRLWGDQLVDGEIAILEAAEEQDFSPPVAVDDTFVVPEGQTSVLNVVHNDTFVGPKSALKVELWNGSSWTNTVTTSRFIATVRDDNDIDFTPIAASAD